MKLPVLVLMLSCACCYQLAGQDTSRVSVFFAGDIMQHESQLISARTDTVAPYSYDFDSWFMFVGEDISASDVAIGNLEVPLRVSALLTSLPLQRVMQGSTYFFLPTTIAWTDSNEVWSVR